MVASSEEYEIMENDTRCTDTKSFQHLSFFCQRNFSLSSGQIILPRSGNLYFLQKMLEGNARRALHCVNSVKSVQAVYSAALPPSLISDGIYCRRSW